VSSHRCQNDQIVRQQLDPATTTRSGFGHRRRADWLRVLDLRLTSRAGSGSASSPPPPPVVAAASPAATSIGSGASMAASRVSGATSSTGTADGEDKCISQHDDYDYSTMALQPQ
jgi:hypothetical protein